MKTTTDHADLTDKGPNFVEESFRRGAETSTRAARAPQTLFRREGGDNFFEARIAAPRIPKRLQLRISIVQRCRNVNSRSKLFNREILVAKQRRARRKPIESTPVH